MSYLVDTSVLTRLGHPQVRSRVEAADVDGLARCTMTDLEIGFSARNGAEWDRLAVAVSRFTRLDVHAHHIERALVVQRLLAEQGLRGRKVPDLLVAAVAEAAGRRVLHYDRDFDHIASVTGQPVEWVVAAGTID